MPSLEQHPSSSTTKMLLVGDPGSGKTGGLASLADAGYQLNIIDLDNGLDILRNLLLDPKSPYNKEAVKKVKYITITEKPQGISSSAGIIVPKSATVWNRIVSTITNWKTESEELGSITTWGPKDILVLDSMTLAGIAAYNFAAVQNMGKTSDGRMIYFQAQNYLENLITAITGSDVKCNVIVTSHITFIGDEVDQTMHGYPTTMGRALSTKIGRYFNTILMIKSERNGERRLYTAPTSRVELKNSSPLKVKPHYLITKGLAQYFQDVQVSALVS